MAKSKAKMKSASTRAARRAHSPSAMDVDANAKPAEWSYPTATETPAVLQSQSASGVAKHKTKQVRRQQRLRREKGVERAEAVSAQLEKKVGDSAGRGRRIRERARQWDDVNDVAAAVADAAGARSERERKKQRRSKDGAAQDEGAQGVKMLGRARRATEEVVGRLGGGRQKLLGRSRRATELVLGGEGTAAVDGTVAKQVAGLDIEDEIL